MNKPVRTTIVFALLCGLSYLPLSSGLGRLWLYPSGFQLVIWTQLAIYAVLLARWSHTRIMAILFPLLVLLVLALLPGAYSGFVILALCILSWIRSGICFHQSAFRSLMAEIVTVVGGVTLCLLLAGNSALSLSLGISLFGLVQALYFFIVPTRPEEKKCKAPQDPFEHAFQEAEKIVGVR